MTTKSVLPSLDDDLAPPKPKTKADLRSVRSPVVSDDIVAANSAALGADWRAQTSLPAPATAKPVMVSLRAEVPNYVDEAISRAAFERKVTKNYVMLEALHKAGFKIHPEDLVADGRKARRKREV